MGVDAAAQPLPAPRARVEPEFGAAAEKFRQRARHYVELAEEVDVAMDSILAVATDIAEGEGGMDEGMLGRVVDAVRRLAKSRAEADQLGATTKAVADQVEQGNPSEVGEADWRARLAEARRERSDPDEVARLQDKAAADVRRRVREAEGGELSEDEGEDLVMATQSLPTMCPLTRELLADPVTSTACSHTYSRAAIMQHIRNTSRRGGGAPCPVAGCRGRITAATIKSDRRVAAHVERHARLQSQGGGDGDGKGGASSSSSAAAASATVDLDDDDDDDDGEDDEEDE